MTNWIYFANVSRETFAICLLSRGILKNAKCQDIEAGMG